MTLKQIKADAAKYSRARGHKLGHWEHRISPNRVTALAKCRHCACYVAVNSNPLPNDIAVSGTAVSLHCMKGTQCPDMNR